MSMAAWLDVEEEAEEVEEAQLDLITLVFRVRTGDQVELSTSLKTGYSQAMPWNSLFPRVSQEQNAPRAPGLCSASASH